MKRSRHTKYNAKKRILKVLSLKMLIPPFVNNLISGFVIFIFEQQAQEDDDSFSPAENITNVIFNDKQVYTLLCVIKKNTLALKFIYK